MAAQAGHTVSFSRVAHRSQTVVVRTLDSLIIRLVPNVNILEEVEVRHLGLFLRLGKVPLSGGNLWFTEMNMTIPQQEVWFSESGIGIKTKNVERIDLKPRRCYPQTVYPRNFQPIESLSLHSP